MFLKLYDVNRSTIQFHEKLLPAQGKSDKCFQTNKVLGWFLFFNSEMPYKSLFTEERNRTFHIGLDNYFGDLAEEWLQEILGRMKVGIYFFEGGYCYAALMRPNKVETRLQLHLGRWPCGC